MRRALIQSVTAPISNWPQCLDKQQFKLDFGGSVNYERLSKREERDWSALARSNNVVRAQNKEHCSG